MTSTSQLRTWFYEAAQKKAAYMVVLCDTFDHEDYPAFCETAAEARTLVAKPGSMQTAMEVYDIALGWDAQGKPGTRVFNLPREEAGSLPPRFHAGSPDTAPASIRGFDDESVTSTEADALDRKAEAEAAVGLSQKARAGRIVVELSDALSQIDILLPQLAAVVGEAQNRPDPDDPPGTPGCSDGTIDEQSWYWLRDLAAILRTMQRAVVERMEGP